MVSRISGKRKRSLGRRAPHRSLNHCKGYGGFCLMKSQVIIDSYTGFIRENLKAVWPDRSGSGVQLLAR